MIALHQVSKLNIERGLNSPEQLLAGERLQPPNEFFVNAEPYLPDGYAQERSELLQELIEGQISSIYHRIVSAGLNKENEDYFLGRLNDIENNIVIDLATPPGVGGYFSLEKGIIGIPPMIALFSSRDELVRIISHELNHAVLDIRDEGMTDSMSIDETTGEQGRVGYPAEVEEYKHWFGHLDTQDTIGLLDKDPQITLMNIMVNMLGQHSRFPDPNQVTPAVLRDELKKYWGVLISMFPRLINEAMGSVDLTSMQVEDPRFLAFWHQYEFQFCLAYWGSPEAMQNMES